MNNSRSKINNVYSFKKVIDDIVDANLTNKGMVKYVSAKVVGINSNGTVNVYIPPDNSNIVNGLANKSGELLSPGDSVELCTKNGSLKNAWISVKHGIGTAGGAKVIDNLTNTSTTDALSANMGKTLNDRITSSTNAYWIGWAHAQLTLDGGHFYDWSNMTTYKSENISYSGKTITFGVSGLYYIKGYAHFKTNPVRSFITLEFSNAGDYCATIVRSNDTENMVGDPAYELNYMAYIKAGATMDITIYLKNTSTLDGTSGWDSSSSGFCIYKIGNYIGE